MKKLTLIIGFSLLNILIFSQENSKPKLDNSIREWTPIAEESNVLINYKFVDCEAEIGYDQELILFQITNNSDQKIEIEWFMHLYYNGVCKTCDYPDEYIYVLTVEPNQTIEGECSMYSEYRLKAFSKFLDERYTGGTQLTSFELKNIKVTSLN